LMLRYLLQFMGSNPNIVKRALLCKKFVLIWSYKDPKDIVKLWNCSRYRLRIMPNKPLEGGSTQKYWNNLWDLSKPVYSNIRAM
jgi:hypothetical protein